VTEPTPAQPDPRPPAPDPAPSLPPITARAVEEAPDPDALVPLTELAPAIQAASVSRRAFLGFGLAIAGGVAGAAALAQLYPVFADDSPAAYPIGAGYDPATRRWTFVVDTATCIGCGMCVAACKEENNVPEEVAYNRTWVERHVRTTTGEVFVDSPEAGINGFPPESTAPGAAGRAIEASWFEPRLCMQCANSPCTVVCPVGATYKTPDGVILVDARRCIGCGYCVVACPYGARYITPAEHSPSGVGGVADKCTWCYHRISRGGKPACVEICPVGARRFGESSDPEMQALVAELEAQPLHPETGTAPVVLYAGPSVEEA
jgi:Fe-S-cluster-containing dehydrogenase component